MGNVHDGKVGQVGGEGVQLAQRPGSEDPVDPLCEFLGREPPVGEVPLQGGDEALTLGVRGTWSPVHPASIPLAGPVLGLAAGPGQIPMRWANSSRW